MRFGARKVEADALVVQPEAGRKLCRDAILRYVPADAPERYARRLAAERRRAQPQSTAYSVGPCHERGLRDATRPPPEGATNRRRGQELQHKEKLQ